MLCNVLRCFILSHQPVLYSTLYVQYVLWQTLLFSSVVLLYDLNVIVLLLSLGLFLSLGTVRF